MTLQGVCVRRRRDQGGADDLARTPPLPLGPSTSAALATQAAAISTVQGRRRTCTMPTEV